MSCAVCLEALGEQKRFLPCTHVFHPACVEPWFAQCRTNNSKLTCPECRTEAPDEECSESDGSFYDPEDERDDEEEDEDDEGEEDDEEEEEAEAGRDGYDHNDPFIASEGTPSIHSSLNEALDNLDLQPPPPSVVEAWNNVRDTVADLFPDQHRVLDAFFRQQ